MKRHGRATWWSLAVFSAGLVIAGLYLDARWDRQQGAARQQALDLAIAQADLLRRQLERSISSLYTLAAVVELNGGVPDFAALASDIIASYGGLTNLQLAPDGRISAIQPLRGNAKAIGLDLLDPLTPGSAEARQAQRERRLIIAGPLRPVQGGVALIARHPVFVSDGDAGEAFWGFVSAFIEIDDLVSATRLDRLVTAGYRYRLSDIDSRPVERLAGELEEGAVEPVTFRFPMAERTWELAVVARSGWQSDTLLVFDAGVAIAICLMLAMLVWSQLRRPLMLAELVRQQTADLDQQHAELEAQIAERESTEALLRDNRARLVSLLQHAKVALFVHDLRGRFIEANPAACHLVGVHRHELLTLSMSDLEVQHSREELEALWAAVRGSVPLTYHGRMRATSGREFPIDVRLSGYRSQETGVMQVVAVVRDASRREALRDELERANTELEAQVAEQTTALASLNRALTLESRVRREAQEQLDRARLEAERASEEKSRFLALISHEIRTPMNGLLGMLALLRAGALAPQQQAYADLADASGKLLMGLLTELVDVSRIEAGTPQARPSSTSLVPLFRQVVGLHRWQADEKGIALHLEFAAGLPVSVEVDALRVRQVAHNLLSNALKFTEQGQVTVRVEMSAPDCLRCVFADSGVGIAPTAQQAIFDSFAQADISIARRYGGTGLGLSITRQLVEVMGGSIDLDSTPGVGSTFTVNLPVSVTRQDVRDADRHQAQRFAGVRVLVAEDNAVNRQVAEGMLKRFGCHCRCVADGRQALQALASERFDMLLMDCQMPVLDGLEATRLLRSEAGGGHRLPVVAMTAHVLPEDRERCRLAGMDDYLPKPVTFDALHTLLQRWFGAGEPKNEDA